MANKLIETEYEIAATAAIRNHIRENGGEQGEDSPWFTFDVPLLLGTNHVIEALERTGYEVEPNGWSLKVRAKSVPVVNDDGDDYWAMRRREG